MREQRNTNNPSLPRRDVETLVIGFGLSVIPLLRELEKNDQQYLVVSGGKSIWEKLEDAGGLDFDLVSSMHSSMYTFELIHQSSRDRYPTAREFHEFIKRHQKDYVHKHVTDWVARIDNYDECSLVSMRSGTVYRCKNLVVATAFRRKLHDALLSLDFDNIHDQTVVIQSSGDSANLIASRLVPRNNKVILVSKGFLALDKFTVISPRPHATPTARANGKELCTTLDQMEFHNVRNLSKALYRAAIGVGGDLGLAFENPLAHKILGAVPFGRQVAQYLRHALNKANFYVQYPEVRRDFEKQFSNFSQRNPMPNGVIVLKYFPIDVYTFYFDDDNLKQHIRDGNILSDLLFFIDQGHVEFWRKEETFIDTERKTISRGEKTVQYDMLVEADRETPNLPPIFSHPNEQAPSSAEARSGEGLAYEYRHRNLYLGTIPKQLKRIYFIGYTRPSTGGLSNLVEMQSLLVHKLVSRSEFRERIYENLETKIVDYNKEYYAGPPEEAGPNDHLVNYGFFNEDIAREIGIAPRLRHCRSLRDIAKLYVFPNNSMKYRQQGEYAVEGVRELVDEIWKRGFFNGLMLWLLVLFLGQVALLAGVVGVLLLPAVPLWAIVPLVPAACLVSVVTQTVQTRTTISGALFFIYLIGLGSSLWLGSVWPFAAALPVELLTASALYKLLDTGSPFNDVEIKRRPAYREFFTRYVRAFNEVRPRSKEPKAKPTATSALQAARGAVDAASGQH